jgi:hypothetical protein
MAAECSAALAAATASPSASPTSGVEPQPSANPIQRLSTRRGGICSAQAELQVWQTCQATGDLLTAHHQPHARWQSTASAASAGSSVATVEVRRSVRRQTVRTSPSRSTRRSASVSCTHPLSLLAIFAAADAPPSLVPSSPGRVRASVNATIVPKTCRSHRQLNHWRCGAHRCWDGVAPSLVRRRPTSGSSQTLNGSRYTCSAFWRRV